MKRVYFLKNNFTSPFDLVNSQYFLILITLHLLLVRLFVARDFVQIIRSVVDHVADFLDRDIAELRDLY